MRINTLKYNCLFLICGLFFHLVLYAQIQNKEVLIDKNINKLISNDPKNAIEITQLLLNQPNLKENEKSKLILQLARAYKTKGEYSNALHYLYQDDIYKKYMNDFDLKLIEIGKADVLIEMSFYREAHEILKEIEVSMKGMTDDFSIYAFDALINLEKAKILFKEQKYTETIALLKPYSENIGENSSELGIWYNVSLGKSYLKIHKLETSKQYFLNALKFVNNQDNINSYAKIYIYNGLASVAFQQKKHDESIDLLNQSYQLAVFFNNIFLQEEIILMLNENYLAKNDIQNYKLYSAK
jgi:hypothetical protein